MEQDFQSGTAYPQPEQPNPTKKPWKWVGIALAAVIILSGVVYGLVSLGGSKTSKSADNTASGDSVAATKLFDALAKGASQPNVRVAQFRQTFASKADLSSKTDPGFIQSSIAEIVGQNFRALYAQKVYDTDTFRMQRCQDGTTYIDGQGVSSLNRTPPKSLTEANEYLKTMYKVTENLSFIICPNIGLMPGVTVDLTPARLSDGIMPVTLSTSQANNWKSKVLQAGLFDVKDEDMTMHGDKQVRKYSFSPAKNRTDVNKQLADIFYETGEIDKIKQEHPDAKWQYEFIAINPANGGSVQGFYLVDETTSLPVYSELEGLGSDRPKDSAVSKANLGANRQSYAFPAQPTIDLMSPLEFLQ